MTLARGWTLATLGDFLSSTRTLDPRAFPNETFDLYSVPSHAAYAPEQALGAAIGSAKQVVEAGDVLLCKIVPHIRRGWTVPAAGPRRQIASGEWIVLREHGLEPEYLRRFIVSDGFHKQFMQTVSGVGGSLMRARPSDAAKIQIPIPPLAEQRRIVAKLGFLTAGLSRTRAELERVPGLADRLKSAVLQTVFDSESALARGTQFVEVGEIARISSGYGFPKHLQGGVSGRYPFAKVSDISRAVSTNKGLLSVAANYIDEADLKILKAKPVPAGSTVFAKIGEALRLNRRALASRDLILDNNCMALSPSEHVVPEYLFYFMQTVNLSPFAVATAVPSVRRGDVATLRLPLPDKDEQERAVERIKSAFAHVSWMVAESARARSLLDRLESAIVAKAFRGELVRQDPDEEPASVLLDRIRAKRAAQGRDPQRRRELPRELDRKQLEAPLEAADRSYVTVKESRMVKTRQDDDVRGRPYLASKLRHMRGHSVQDLFRVADLPVADFYKQLAWEIDNKHIIDDSDELRAA